MTVFVNGLQRYHWLVSTGAPGHSTPSGTYTASSMNEIWYSKQWDNAPMPHAVFFTKEGHAIHGTNEIKRLGKPASHGCVRLSPPNAATLYALVEENGLDHTQVVLVGLTPGGEGKIARQGARKVTSAMRYKRRYRTELYFEPQPRGGLFGRRGGGVGKCVNSVRFRRLLSFIIATGGRCLLAATKADQIHVSYKRRLLTETRYLRSPRLANPCCIKATTQADHPSASAKALPSTRSGYYSCASWHW